MTLFNFPFTRLTHRSKPAVATNLTLNSWSHQSYTHSARFVQKIEMCTAVCAGDDAWGTPIDHDHHHTLLRVSLVPTTNSPDGSQDTLLIERVLSTGGAFHSVAPINETLSSGGTILHPDVHDRVCVIYEGSSTTIARGLVVERTITSGGRALSLIQLAQILEFVGRTTAVICDGGDCKFQSRAFAFTCLAAMTPTIPPRKAGEGSASRASSGSEPIDDSVFELTAEAFLAQVSWLVVRDRDAASMQALELIGALKEGPRGRARARLYH
ncbi:hypothetical protein L210DRAFT_3547381 [Boletus edulis BED1]|uniref:Uncharacterized protein n=1 Tax=Boletus edulis BED1 TaxID=1328754 RepID=A0AAD4GDS4_BOLED|nr:hypothetical protein L210DRAFT_3547381 [Boletus edulis BED1]